MARKYAVLVLALTALLLPAVGSNALNEPGSAGQPVTNATEVQTSSSPYHTDFSSFAAALPSGCPLGAWVSKEAVPLLKQYGSYTHANKIEHALTYFPQLTGSGTIRAFRAVSLKQMRDFAAQAKQRKIPYEAFAYDLEGWDQTPLWEREHVVEATRMARDIAHANGKILIMGAARAFTWRNWPKMAPYADMWIIQAQGGQRNYGPNQQFYNWLKGYVDMLRPYNPGMPIWAQLSTAPNSPLTLSQYMAYVNLVHPKLVNGVYVFNPAHLPLKSIWTSLCGQ